MKKRKHSRFGVARACLLFWALFIGIGAVAGAVGMLIDPTGRAMGMDAMLPYFQKLPFSEYVFQDLLFSGIALLIVNGITNLTAAALLLAKKKSGIICSGIFGCTLMLWIYIQFYMFPLNFMSTVYFVFGAFQTATAYAAWVFYLQENFAEQQTESLVGKRESKNLVVYFSRMGYVRKLAVEEAMRIGAELLEIKALERTEGTAGFWWCGRYAMHGWDMPIETIDYVCLQKYDHVTVCSPVWAFSLAAPVRTFCHMAKGQIKEASYILVHHTNGKYQNIADDMDSLLGLRRVSLKSMRCRKGQYKEISC